MVIWQHIEVEHTWLAKHADQLFSEAKRIETLFQANGHTVELFPDIFRLPIRFDHIPVISLRICSDMNSNDCADILKVGGYHYYTEHGRPFFDHMQCNKEGCVLELQIMHRENPYIRDLRHFGKDCLSIAELVEYDYFQRNGFALAYPDAKYSYSDFFDNRIETTLQFHNYNRKTPRQWIAEIMISSELSDNLHRIIKENGLSFQELIDSSYAYALFHIDTINEHARGKMPVQIIREYPVYVYETKERARQNDQEYEWKCNYISALKTKQKSISEMGRMEINKETRNAS